MSGWHHENANWKEKDCPVCNKQFKPKGGHHKFCSDECEGKWKYVSGQVTTESQYKEISGNWLRYCSRLIYAAGRKRDNLTRDDILKKIEEQNYKCALSGIDLTCQLEKGVKFWTNASIDRIIPGGPYTYDNIQVVCRGLNSWRADTPLEDFIEICRKVAEHHPKKESEIEDGRT